MMAQGSWCLQRLNRGLFDVRSRRCLLLRLWYVLRLGEAWFGRLFCSHAAIYHTYTYARACIMLLHCHTPFCCVHIRVRDHYYHIRLYYLVLCYTILLYRSHYCCCHALSVTFCDSVNRSTAYTVAAIPAYAIAVPSGLTTYTLLFRTLFVPHSLPCYTLTMDCLVYWKWAGGTDLLHFLVWKVRSRVTRCGYFCLFYAFCSAVARCLRAR